MKKILAVVVMLVVTVMFTGIAWAEDNGFDKVIGTAHRLNFTQCDDLIKATFYDFGLNKLSWSYNATSKNRVFSIQFVRHYTNLSDLISLSFISLPDGCNSMVEQTTFFTIPCDLIFSERLKNGYTVESEDKEKGVVTISNGATVKFLIPREKGCHETSRALYTWTFKEIDNLLADVMESVNKTAKTTEPVRPADNKVKEEPQAAKPQFRE